MKRCFGNHDLVTFELRGTFLAKGSKSFFGIVGKGIREVKELSRPGFGPDAECFVTARLQNNNSNFARLFRPADGILELRFTASRSHANPSQLRALVVRPPGAPDGVQVQSFAVVQSASVPNVELESAAFRTPAIECVALRYGFFYGPGTWYTSAGDMGEQVRQRHVPIIGKGEGVWSFVHIEDAAAATAA